MFTNSTYKPVDIYLGNIPAKQALKVTEQQILRLTNTAAEQIKDFAQQFKADSVKQTAYNIWKYIKNNFRYQRDDFGTEQIRSPQRLLYDKVGDCEDYSIFAASILKALGYDPKFYIVAFNGKPNYSHIYVVVDGIVLDGVMNEFNRHPKNITKYKVLGLDGSEKIFFSNPDDMDIYVLNGIEPAYDYFVQDTLPFVAGVDRDGYILMPEPVADIADKYLTMLENPSISGLGDIGSIRDWWRKNTQKIKSGWTKIKRTSGKVTHTIKKYGFAGARGAFLGLLKLNFLHLASKLYLGYLTREQAQRAGLDLNEWQKLVNIRKRFEQLWTKAGGDIKALKKAVISGRAKRWLAKKGVHLAGLGIEPVSTAAAGTTAAAVSAPFWKKLLEWFSKNVDFDKLLAKATDITKKAFEPVKEPVQVPEVPTSYLPEETTTKTNSNILKFLPFLSLLFII